jgi:hypothetical protein
MTIPCPFVYANGRKCPGHVTSVAAFKCDVSWKPDADGRWRPAIGQMRSHYHLSCSEKGTHAENFGREDSPQMKVYNLPDGLTLL